MRTLIIALIAAAICAPPAHADDMAAASASLQAAQERAQAEAVRPGDDALTCEELEAEMIAVMNTPEMQAAMDDSMDTSAAMGAQAEDMARSARGSMAMNMAMGLAGQFVPGLGLVQGMMMRNQMAAQNAQSQAQMIEAYRSLEVMMPGLMRGQRVSELAQAKNCAFVAYEPPVE